MDIVVRNATQAVNAVLTYMRDRKVDNAPDVEAKWRQKTLYSSDPQDLAVTGNLFTADGWIIEVSQTIAPLSRTVYYVTVFNASLHSYWKGTVRADNGVVDVSSFGSLSEDESRQAEEEFAAKSRILPPKPGGYGH